MTHTWSLGAAPSTHIHTHMQTYTYTHVHTVKNPLCSDLPKAPCKMSLPALRIKSPLQVLLGLELGTGAGMEERGAEGCVALRCPCRGRGSLAVRESRGKARRPVRPVRSSPAPETRPLSLRPFARGVQPRPGGGPLGSWAPASPSAEIFQEHGKFPVFPPFPPIIWRCIIATRIQWCEGEE